jgi:hypothetical protein
MRRRSGVDATEFRLDEKEKTMDSSVTINIPTEMKQDLIELSREEGISFDEAVRQAIQQTIALKKFRSLRKRMMAKAGSKVEWTDQDVFDQIS